MSKKVLKKNERKYLIVGLTLSAISLLIYIAESYANSNYDISQNRSAYATVLLGTALFSFIVSVICFVFAVMSRGKQSYLLVFAGVANLLIAGLQLFAGTFTNH